MKKSNLLMLDENKKKLTGTTNSLNNLSVVNKTPQKIRKEKDLKKYVEFFKDQISQIENISDPDFSALEIVNDEGLTVSSELQKSDGLTNFQVCNIGYVNKLLQHPAELKKVNLVLAVLPFEDAFTLTQCLSQIPEASNTETRVALGVYGGPYDPNFDFNKRVLSFLMSKLDFFEYKGDEINGTNVKTLYSTYQKNMKKRH